MTLPRNYLLLLASQSLSAFGDQFVLAVIIGQLTFLKRDGAITDAAYQSANAIYPSLLFIPYVLFGPVTGYLNDRFAKTRWLLGGNAVKFAGTLLAAASLALGSRDMAWQGVGYFIIGIGACVYGPAKYGILPEILPTERLVKANGTVEMLTLLSILLGALGGARMIDHNSPLLCYGVLLGIYGAALALNACMMLTPHNENVRWQSSVGEFFRHYGGLLTHRRLGKVLIGTAIFWICGAVMKMNFNPWGLNELGFKNEANPNTAIAMLGLWLAVGVMIGSVLAGQFHKVGDLTWTQRYGWMLAVTIMLLGSVGMWAFWTEWTVTVPRITFNLLVMKLVLGGFQILVWIVLVLIVTGFFAGLFLIPLNAALQAESDPAKLGKTIACQNFQENIAMSVSGMLVFLAAKADAAAPHVFIGLAVLVFIAVTLLRIPRNETKPA